MVVEDQVGLEDRTEEQASLRGLPLVMSALARLTSIRRRGYTLIKVGEVKVKITQPMLSDKSANCP